MHMRGIRNMRNGILLILFAIFALSFLAFADGPAVVTPSGTPPTPAPDKYLICFCTSGGHASVHLFDGSTGKNYGRGLWANGFGKGGEAPKLPPAGGSVPAGTGAGTGGGSSSSGSSGSSSGSSSSSSGSGSSDSSSSSSDSPSDSSSSSSGSSSGSTDLDVFNGPGTIRNEGGVKGKKCICYEITKDEYNKAVDFINNYPRRYRLLSQNCMDFTSDVAAHLGKEIPGTNYWGVSHPQVFYDNLNAWKATWATQNYSGKFIAYGSNETGKFLPYMNASNVSKETAFRTDVERTGYAEDLLNNPERAYRALATKSELGPTIASISVEAGEIEYCGGQCIKISKNQPITFGLGITPAEKSMMWWEFGVGARAIGTNPTYTFSKVGNYTVRAKYFDESGAVASSMYKVIVTEPQPGNASPIWPPGFCPPPLPQKPKIKLITADGIEIKVDDSEFSEVYKDVEGMPPEIGKLITNEVLRLHFRLKSGEIVIGQLKTNNDGKVEEARIFGVADIKNERLFESNPSVFVDCVPVTYTAALYLDEETIERIIDSQNPEIEFKKAWGKTIRYNGLSFWSGAREFFMKLFLGF